MCYSHIWPGSNGTDFCEKRGRSLLCFFLAVEETGIAVTASCISLVTPHTQETCMLDL